MQRITRWIRPVLLVLSFALVTVLPVTAQESDEPNDDVRITITSEPDTLARDGGGTLLIDFSPMKGFHVNAIPAMRVVLDSASPAGLTDSLTITVDNATGYLDCRSPVRQPFALKKGTKTGGASVSGTLTYYYCSDTEGWCRREKKTFAIPVTLR